MQAYIRSTRKLSNMRHNSSFVFLTFICTICCRVVAGRRHLSDFPLLCPQFVCSFFCLPDTTPHSLSPDVAVYCNRFPGLDAGRSTFYITLGSITEQQRWKADTPRSRDKFTIEDGLWNTSILHAADMANTTTIIFFCLLHEFTYFASVSSGYCAQSHFSNNSLNTYDGQMLM